VILGDTGGLHEVVLPGTATDYNIALILDVSGSMNDLWGPPGQWERRIDTAKKALKEFLSEHLATHTGHVNVSLVTFNSASSGVLVKSVVDLNESNLAEMLNAVDSVTAGGGTYYSSGFLTATAWYNDMVSQGYGDYTGKTYFMSDGAPGDDVIWRTNRFNALRNHGEVNAIGIGTGVNKSNLDPYDTTPVQATPVNAVNGPWDMYGNFENDMGINNPNNAWVLAGVGTITRPGGFLNITNTNSTPGSSVIATMHEAHRIIVDNPNGGFIRFYADAMNYNAADVYTWRLLKWDAAQNDWVVVQAGNVIPAMPRVITTGNHGSGEYRLQFEVEDRSPQNGQAWFYVDNIEVTRSIGDSVIVTNPNDLTAALVGDTTTLAPIPGGADVVHGGGGDDIIFGDAINTSNLPWGQGGNPTKPSGRT